MDVIDIDAALFRTIESWLSWGVSLALLFLCFWGVVHFFPKKEKGTPRDGTYWLILAIWLGFLGSGLNVLYWRVLGDAAVSVGLLSVAQLRWFGGTWGDMLWKGLGALAVYMHFYARYKNIPTEHQKQWTPLMMGYYPNTDHWMYKILMVKYLSRLTSKKDRE